jgi:hypothetical protein
LAFLHRQASHLDRLRFATLVLPFWVSLLWPVAALALAVFAFPVATSLSLRNTALMIAMRRRPCTGLARLPLRKHPAEATQSLQFGRRKSNGIFPAVGAQKMLLDMESLLSLSSGQLLAPNSIGEI